MPNVVIIYLDQMAYYALGSYGNSFVQTPNIDRLASGGLQFDLGITNNPLCTPARASLLSGQYSRTALGAIGNEPADESSPRERTSLLDPILPEIFQQAGYHTGAIGKWHMPSDPFLLGFDYALHAVEPDNLVGGYYNRTFRENHTDKAKLSIDNAEETFVEGFIFDFLSKKTRDYIATHANNENPFFLYYTIELPHMPIGPGNLPNEYVTMYDPDLVPLRNNVFKNGELAYDEWWFKVYTISDYIFRNVPTPVPDRKSDELPEGFNLRDLTAYYYGAVTATDDLVGEVLDALESAGISENTIVVLSSDHGENLGSHHWFNKDLLIDESIRVPMIFRYPKSVEPAVNRKQVASMIDVMPTLLELTGLKGPDSMQGQSLLSVLRGETETLPRNHAMIETEFYHIGIRTPTYLYGMEIRDTEFVEEWPYFSTKPGSKRLCLFDLETDPYQQHNLTGLPQYASIEAELSAKLSHWNDTTSWAHGDPPPLPNWMLERAGAPQ
ncbi:MAG: hypothetical protein CMN58_06265 [Solibacterales bacterium]|nr:hypothetical protein [Bryobacterales bacterium]|tara:strand:- start:167544 stop:169037 length:1494 start_codon:yes stop_codon:yes gene_type:complete